MKLLTRLRSETRPPQQSADIHSIVSNFYYWSHGGEKVDLPRWHHLMQVFTSFLGASRRMMVDFGSQILTRGEMDGWYLASMASDTVVVAVARSDRFTEY